jgi:hypothetical protein
MNEFLKEYFTEVNIEDVINQDSNCYVFNDNEFENGVYTNVLDRFAKYFDFIYDIKNDQLHMNKNLI